MLFHLLYSKLSVMREIAEQMEEIRERQVEERREVEGRQRDEKSNKKEKETGNQTHTLVIQWRQNNCSLDGVQHYFP